MKDASGKSPKGSHPWAISALCLFLASGLCPVTLLTAKTSPPSGPLLKPEIQLLLSRLDLDAPGLKAVNASQSDAPRAARELLSYYRSRTFVKHPVDRRSKTGSLGRYASVDDLRMADDALRHVFKSQGAYPPYFCGDDINWACQPVPDPEWIWQLHRMYFWNAMARAYWHSSDEKYAREWRFQLLGWIKKNPNDSQHDYAWRSLETGLRGQSWTVLFQHFLDSPSFTADVLAAFLNSCHDHASLLMIKHRPEVNWGLYESEGLLSLAVFFPEFKESGIWRTTAIDRLNSMIANQIYPDGHQRELSISYHLGAIEGYAQVYDFAAMNGLKDAFPESYPRTVEKMREVPMKLGLPDGTVAQFGDSWTGTSGALWERLEKWGRLYNREDFLYVGTEGREGRKPEATAFALDKSGFYSLRSGWDKNAICLVLKCGPDGEWHCQPDNGTFELYAGGRHLMPDSGVYIYSGDPENRAWFRQTRVHQTLTLDGQNTAYAPKLLLWKPGKSADILVVENASYDNLTHRRAVFFLDKKLFVIVDEALGDGDGEVDLHFQLAPGKAIFDADNLSVQSGFPDGWNVLVKSSGPRGMKLEEEEGQVSFVYNKKEPRPAFRYRVRKKKEDHGIRFLTVVVPFSDSRPEVSARIIGQPEPGASRIELEIGAEGLVRRVTYDLDQPNPNGPAMRGAQPETRMTGKGNVRN